MKVKKMKEYKVRVHYSGVEHYTLTAEDEGAAQQKALEFFSRGEPSNDPTGETKVEKPTWVVVTLDGEVVNLPQYTMKKKRGRRTVSKK
jgi:hypothetical protein